MSTTTDSRVGQLRQASLDMRRHILRLALGVAGNRAHIGPALSLVEILTVLYLDVLRRAELEPVSMRDKCILSKGHGALAYYVALYKAGIISLETLNTYEVNGGDLPGQPVKNSVVGIDFSSGSLGHGLAYGAGLALGARMTQSDTRVYVVLGDGEFNEGAVWESAMFAAHQKLTSLTAIVDRNGMQSDGRTSDILTVDIPAMLHSTGWNVAVCDGHDVGQLLGALRTDPDCKPRAIVANTVKGKGVSFMEGNNEWHHAQLSQENFARAMTELDAFERSPR